MYVHDMCELTCILQYITYIDMLVHDETLQKIYVHEEICVCVST